VSNIVTDFVFTTLPIYVVWNLKICIRQKVAISGLITLGLFATGCSVARMAIYQNFEMWDDQTCKYPSARIEEIVANLHQRWYYGYADMFCVSPPRREA